jgi:hypothetical protein
VTSRAPPPLPPVTAAAQTAVSEVVETTLRGPGTARGTRIELAGYGRVMCTEHPYGGSMGTKYP